MIVITTGGRDQANARLVDETLRGLMPIACVFCGCCPTGADDAVRAWCRTHEVTHHIEHAKWRMYGDQAGPIRNARMLQRALAMQTQESWERIVCVVFPGGTGTADCAARAEELDIKIVRPTLDLDRLLER